MRAERLRISSGAPPARSPQSVNESTGNLTASKKRKAGDQDVDEDSRKRNKPEAEPPGGFFDEIIQRNNESASEISEAPPKIHMNSTEVGETKPPSEPVNEDEWAAFERDIAKSESPRPPTNSTALNATADIAAAPTTSESSNVQPEGDPGVQRKERREAETEGEREDATRALEEEFDEMEDLEARIKRLREKREELRVRREDGGEQHNQEGESGSIHVTETRVGDESSEDDDDVDDWDQWARG